MNTFDIFELTKKYGCSIEFEYVGFGNGYRIIVTKRSYQNHQQIMDLDVFKDGQINLLYIIESMCRDLDAYISKRKVKDE